MSHLSDVVEVSRNAVNMMMNACTYPVLLVFTVLGFADADAVALPFHSLVLLVPHWLASLMS